MKILALNCGSSTVKFQLFETAPDLIAQDADRVLAKGAVDRIGAEEGAISFQPAGGQPRSLAASVRSHQEALHAVFACLTDPGDGVLARLDEIEGIGHRMVYVGEEFRGPVRIDEEVRRMIEEAAHLAPLHTPHNIRGYLAATAELPACPNVAVFDTAFHHSIPPKAYLYGLPYEIYTEQRIRRYGFHGISHQYVFERYCRIGGGRKTAKVITCHLGSGASMCAIERGRSVDTSLGFSPLAGLMMCTRPGDLDPGALLQMMATESLSVGDVGEMLNKRSGLLGLSGLSNDMRELIAASRGGHERARLAIDVFCYRIRKYIGTYFAVLNGCDAILFTGGIGENAPLVRAMGCANLDGLGIAIDPEKNESAVGKEAEITAPGAHTETWVIPTNEELLIARETVRLL